MRIPSEAIPGNAHRERTGGMTLVMSDSPPRIVRQSEPTRAPALPAALVEVRERHLDAVQMRDAQQAEAVLRLEVEAEERRRKAWAALIRAVCETTPAELLPHLLPDGERLPDAFDLRRAFEFAFVFRDHWPILVRYARRADGAWVQHPWSPCEDGQVSDPLGSGEPYMLQVRKWPANLVCPDLGAALAAAHHDDTQQVPPDAGVAF